MQAAAVIGELWLSYDIVLYKPQLSSGLGLDIDTAVYNLTAPVVSTAYMGTARSAKIDTLGLSFSDGAISTGNAAVANSAAATTFNFPKGSQGYYLINYSVTGDSTAVVNATYTLTNCVSTADDGSTLTIWNSASNISNSGSTSVNYMRNFVIYIADPNLQASVVLSGGTFPANPTGGVLFVLS